LRPTQAKILISTKKEKKKKTSNKKIPEPVTQLNKEIQIGE
jgi:hypothetical protein